MPSSLNDSFIHLRQSLELAFAEKRELSLCLLRSSDWNSFMPLLYFLNETYSNLNITVFVNDSDQCRIPEENKRITFTESFISKELLVSKSSQLSQFDIIIVPYSYDYLCSSYEPIEKGLLELGANNIWGFSPSGSLYIHKNQLFQIASSEKLKMLKELALMGLSKITGPIYYLWLNRKLYKVRRALKEIE